MADSTPKSSPTSLHQLTFILQQRYDDHLISRVGVGFAQTRIMEVLDDRIPRSQRYIALALGQTEANVSRQLGLMKRQGLVSVTKNAKDRRQRDVMLTKDGAAKLKKAQKILEEQQNELFELLSAKEIAAFNRATENLLKALHVPLRGKHKTIG